MYSNAAAGSGSAAESSVAPPSPSSTGISGLLSSLVSSILPPSSSPAHHASQLSWALRLASSGPRATNRPGRQETETVQEAQKAIIYRSMQDSTRDVGLSKATEFSSLYKKWRYLCSTASSQGHSVLVEKRGEMLYFLKELEGMSEELRLGSRQLAIEFQQGRHIAQEAKENKVSQRQQAAQQQQIATYDPAIRTALAYPAPLNPSELSESELLRDLLYIFLGSDGNHIKYHPSADAYLLLPGLQVPRPQRLLVQRVAELGWLYKKVQTYVTDVMEGDHISVAGHAATAKHQRTTQTPSTSTAPTPSHNRQQSSAANINTHFLPQHSGKIEQAFAAALRDELNEYLRFITLLQTQVDKELRTPPSRPALPSSVSMLTAASPNPTPPPPAHNGAQFTLHRLLVFEQDAIQTMALLGSLVESVRGVKGACLASVLGIHLRHGDPFVVNLMKKVMTKTCVPLFEMLNAWVSTGSLNDPYSEFFIASNGKVAFERIWFDKFTLRRTMIPTFFTEELVEKIMGIGKAVNFIREVCKETEYTLKVKVHTYLLHLLKIRYNFLSHALSLKKYLLLSAGDFSATLLELIGGELDKSLRDSSHSALLGILESAKRASSVKDEPDEVAMRLSIRRADHSSSSSISELTGAGGAPNGGWATFAIEYVFESESPLRTVFSPKTLDLYTQLFTFLWQLKRVDRRLSEAWANQTKLGHAAELRQLGVELGGSSSSPNGPNELEGFLRNVAGTRNEMAHFVSNFHSYVMFEVVETGWEEFVHKVQGTQPPSAYSATTMTSTTHTAIKTMPNTPAGGGNNSTSIGFERMQATTTPPSAQQNTPTKQLDLDGLIQAHKIFLQQIVDKVLMGGSGGSLYPQLLTLFDLLLSFTSFHTRLYNFLGTEVARRKELARAAARSAETGKWNTAATKNEEAKRIFVVELSKCVREFSTINQRFHSTLLAFHRALKEANRAAVEAVKRTAREENDGDEDEVDGDSAMAVAAMHAHTRRSTPRDILGSPQPSIERKARRQALHLHSLDFLRFRLDFNEFYAVNKRMQQAILAQYERTNGEPNENKKAIVARQTAATTRTYTR